MPLKRAGINELAIRKAIEYNSPLTLPLGFNRWVPDFNIYGSGVGGYTTDLNITADRPTGAEVFVATNGNDTTGDGTISNPYRSIKKAYDENADVIAVRAGHYDEDGNWRGGATFAPARDLRIYAYDGAGTVEISTGIPGLSWAQESAPNANVYSADITGYTIRNIVDKASGGLKATDTFYVGNSGTAIPLPYDTEASIAAVQANPSSYYVDGNTLYIHTEDSRAPDADVIVLNDNNNLARTGSGVELTLYLEGLEVWGDLAIYFEPNDVNKTDLWLIDTAARYGGQNIPAWRIGAIRNSRAIRAQSTHHNDADLFSYTGSGDISGPNVLEIDCVSEETGTATNDNASTGHDGANIIRLNGVYRNTTGPVIADVLGTQSVNLGCTVSGALGAGLSGALMNVGTADAVHGTSKMWVGDCRLHGTANYSFVQSSGGELYTFSDKPNIDEIGTTHGTITSVTSNWRFENTSPDIWYDLQDMTYLVPNADNTFLDYLPVATLRNKANSGTYDATQTGTNIILNAEEMNNHISLANRGNGSMTNGFYPDENLRSFGAVFNMPTSASTRAVFGCNDNASRRFYIQTTSSGEITIGFGDDFVTTTTTYAAGTQMRVLVVGNGSTYEVWINGVQEFSAEAYSFSGTSTDEMYLHGRTSGGVATAFFNTGHLAEVAVWNRTLSADEIKLVLSLWEGKYLDLIEYHVISLIGQSNMAGLQSSEVADYTGDQAINHRIHQVNRAGGSFDDQIIPAFEPLKHNSSSQKRVGMGYSLGKRYLQTLTENPFARVLLVPTAEYASGFNDGEWVVTTGPQYLDTIDRCNVAMLQGHHAEFKFFAWQQLEDDVGDMTLQQYVDFLDAMLTGLRAGITGATGAPLTFGYTVPDFDAGVLATAPAEAASQLTGVYEVPRPANVDDVGDDLHYNLASVVAYGVAHTETYLNNL